MSKPRQITLYTDYKSPYAYWRRTWRIAWSAISQCGSSACPTSRHPELPRLRALDADGSVLEENRNAHQWRRVRYSYMDCRRQARKRGLVIRGPQKIWDSALAAAGMLFAQRAGDAVFRRYNDIVFERFWQRALDIEDVTVISAVLAEAGGDGAAFATQAQAGRDEVAEVSRAAEAIGVFGVPTFVVDGELFWGSEHLPDIRAMLTA